MLKVTRMAKKVNKTARHVGLLVLTFLLISMLLLFWAEQLLLPNIIDVNRYYSVIVSPSFEIKPPFSFPQPDGIKSVEEISNMNWIHHLADIMENKKHKTIYLLTCDNYAYPSLVNWLVSAYINTQIDIEDILVLSLDETLHRTLIKRDIPSVHVKTEEFIRYNYFLSWTADRIWLLATVRMSIARLISHWGFNVAMFDIDAIPLKDPENLYQIFSDSDVIISHSLTGKEDGESSDDFWSMSLGFAFFRSNRNIEYLWEYSSNITDNRWQVEQKLSQVINVHFNTQWSLETKRTDVCQTHMSYLCDISGVTKIGLKTTLVSRWAVCSYCGNSRMEDYYVWHKQNNGLSQADRQLTAQVGSVWFLKNEWEKIDKRSIHSREKWLHELTDGT